MRQNISRSIAKASWKKNLKTILCWTWRERFTFRKNSQEVWQSVQKFCVGANWGKTDKKIQLQNLLGLSKIDLIRTTNCGDNLVSLFWKFEASSNDKTLNALKKMIAQKVLEAKGNNFFQRKSFAPEQKWKTNKILEEKLKQCWQQVIVIRRRVFFTL